MLDITSIFYLSYEPVYLYLTDFVYLKLLFRQAV